MSKSKLSSYPTTNLIILGNPGCAGFYLDFAKELFSRLDCSVYILSHGGMVKNPSETLSRSRDLKSVMLFDQIKQKELILEELDVYSKPNLILISHSIGALMMLHLIKPSVKLAIGLTPTIERMKEMTLKYFWFDNLHFNYLSKNFI